MTPENALLQIEVLGPLEVRLDGRPVLATAAKPRQVLALLALNAGTVVPVPTLIEELWGQEPPRSAMSTLQTYVLQLRKLFDGASTGGDGTGKDVLRTRFGGYVLDVARDQVDAGRHDRLVTAGERAFDARDHEACGRLLGTAAALWRGRPLVDVRLGTHLTVEATRLEESRLSALETRIDADLHLGRHHSLLSELAVLRARHPMHENLCALHMVALYRAGRQWQALEAYATLRKVLADELGVEPSGRLRQLQKRILDADVTLDILRAHERFETHPA